MGTIFGAHIPFADLCGFEPLGCEGGVTRLRLQLQPHHTNNMGIAHGGVIATLLDTAMGTAARLAAGYPVMTLEMNVNYLSAGEGELIAEGRVTRAGKSILFAEASVSGANGPVAKSSGVFKAAAPKAGSNAIGGDG